MLIFISAIVLLAITFFYAKKFFIRRLQSQYEKSLLNGDKNKSQRLGRFYYFSLSEESRKAKGIENIEEKISDDFRSFNNKSFSFLI